MRFGHLCEDARFVLGLHVGIAVVDEEERRGIETEAVESEDDRGETVELTEDLGDVVCEDVVAVVEERGENPGELFDLDFATEVLVLERVRVLVDLVDLERREK